MSVESLTLLCAASIYKGLRLLFNKTCLMRSPFHCLCGFTFMLFLGVLTGCSLFLPKTPPPPAKDKNLKVIFSMPGWKTTDPHESDYAWSNEQRGDVLLVNSFCGEFQDLSLETLALKTFDGYQEFKPLGKNTTEWEGREAFEMEAEARLDGVKILLHLRNYRRDHCYYDFILVSPRTRAQESLLAFRRLLDGVVFK